MASRLGDQTARLQGRITLNPMYHIDPIGTLLFPALVIFGPLIGFHLPFMLVGWAKPTPSSRATSRKSSAMTTSPLSPDPFSNLILVVVALVALVVMAKVIPNGAPTVQMSFAAALGMADPSQAHPVALLLSLAILINFSLFFFNLLPIPPLDGSRVVRNMLPYNAVRVYDRIGGWISYLLMIFVRQFPVAPGASARAGWSFRCLATSRKAVHSPRPLPLQWNERLIWSFIAMQPAIFPGCQELESQSCLNSPIDPNGRAF